ncbi:MAG: hypothetical protein WBE54_05535, partial [Bradyrhizobium sp.]
PLASANHILLTNVLEGFGMTRIRGSRRSSGDATMWVALEVNFALWGMILCATVEAAERFSVF